MASQGLALNLCMNPSSASLRFSVDAGTRYQVQMSRDLIIWRNRDIIESGFTGDYAWSDPDPARDMARYYRVLAVDKSSS